MAFPRFAGCAQRALPSVMLKRRTADDPWYTTIYREPHTMWWAPAVFLFVVIFVVARANGDTVAEASGWAAAWSAVYAVGGYVSWRRSRR